MSATPIACLLSEAEQSERQRELSVTLLHALQETRELADGYALRFPPEREWLEALTAFVAFERACCPFLLFAIRCGPGADAPLWLEIRAESAEAKDFIRSAFVETTLLAGS